MKPLEVVRQAANSAGIPITHIGVSMGKARTYVNTAIAKNAIPQCDTMARMLDVCGYSLCAIPTDKIPNDAIVIDGDANAD